MVECYNNKCKNHSQDEPYCSLGNPTKKDCAPVGEDFKMWWFVEALNDGFHKLVDEDIAYKIWRAALSAAPTVGVLDGLKRYDVVGHIFYGLPVQDLEEKRYGDWVKYKGVEMQTAKIRQAIANYMRSEGCDCCQDREAHKEHKALLAKLLNVPKYEDGSGYDFGKFETKKKD